MLQDTQERMVVADITYCGLSHLVAQIFSNTYHVHYNCRSYEFSMRYLWTDTSSHWLA